MSMIGHLRSITDAEKTAADATPSLYEDLVFDSNIEETDNWWDQLWFIYDIWMKNNKITDTPNPSYQRDHESEYVVGIDVGYGRPHYLSPETTKKVYDFLQSVDSAALVKFALTQECNDSLYPHDWPEDMQTDETPHWIITYMESLKAYFAKAVAEGAGMLQAIV